MPNFTSNDEFFSAITNLTGRMRLSGHQEAASEIQAGFSALNGLTDGWAILMESIEKTLVEHGSILPLDQSNELRSMLKTVKKVVYR